MESLAHSLCDVGRKKSSTQKDHTIYKGHLKHFTPEEITELRKKIADILTETKYAKMAELAEIE